MTPGLIWETLFRPTTLIFERPEYKCLNLEVPLLNQGINGRRLGER